MALRGPSSGCLWHSGDCFTYSDYARLLVVGHQPQWVSQYVVSIPRDEIPKFMGDIEVSLIIAAWLGLHCQGRQVQNEPVICRENASASSLLPKVGGLSCAICSSYGGQSAIVRCRCHSRRGCDLCQLSSNGLDLSCIACQGLLPHIAFGLEVGECPAGQLLTHAEIHPNIRIVHAAWRRNSTFTESKGKITRPSLARSSTPAFNSAVTSV